MTPSHYTTALRQLFWSVGRSPLPASLTSDQARAAAAAVDGRVALARGSLLRRPAARRVRGPPSANPLRAAAPAAGARAVVRRQGQGAVVRRQGQEGSHAPAGCAQAARAAQALVCPARPGVPLHGLPLVGHSLMYNLLPQPRMASSASLTAWAGVSGDGSGRVLARPIFRRRDRSDSNFALVVSYNGSCDTTA